MVRFNCNARCIVSIMQVLTTDFQISVCNKVCAIKAGVTYGVIIIRYKCKLRYVPVLFNECYGHGD